MHHVPVKEYGENQVHEQFLLKKAIGVSVPLVIDYPLDCFFLEQLEVLSFIEWLNEAYFVRALDFLQAYVVEFHFVLLLDVTGPLFGVFVSFNMFVHSYVLRNIENLVGVFHLKVF